jgi:hypothetical protein
MDFETAPLDSGNQGWSRGDIIGEVLELIEQIRDRILEFVDLGPCRDRHFGRSVREDGLEGG